ncbi:hypothetical protein PpBr36_05250 [Pyricularia pennisetigena]|uniref:hypothetical protein n=1 Tax=Pyricularia pennisetigena TaxID=1578925 RepID=UPI001153C6B5|nr:hypothetical protein PpBr36_05250 [Pyricularia pennisetigena]TLS26164.1 hypothetical protein PpBr36_05250 [Pyricularia pennisetigena]
MSSRLFSTGARVLGRTSPLARSFQTTTRRFDAVSNATLPARKPVGAFRGGLFGFLFGTTLAGSGVYYYVLQEYKAANDLLTEDIYNLQASVQRLSNYLTTLEDRIEATERRRK